MRADYEARASYRRHSSFFRTRYLFLSVVSFCVTILVARPYMDNGVLAQRMGEMAAGPNHSLSAPAGTTPDAAAGLPTAVDPAPTPVENVKWAKITTAVPLREEPKPTSPEMLEASPGERFPVLQHTNQWFEVKLGDSQTGWLPDRNAAEEVRTESAQILAVRTDTLLYKGPGTSFAQAQTAGANDSYTPKQVSGQWIELQGEGNGDRWIEADDVSWTYGEPAAATAFGATEAGNAGTAEEGGGPLAGKTIVVDPGHGGIDTGARGKIAEVNERDVNLSVALVLERKLQAAGARVIMTRTSNDQTVSLQSRVDLSNRNDADLFVSIHQNMFAQDPTVSGTITFYSGQESEAPAQAIERGALASLGSKEEKVHIEEEQLFVLRNNRRPAVLIEGCFLSNPKELADSLTTGYQEKLAGGIYDGIREYMSN